MIVNRYLQRNIHLGTLAALLVLVSLSLFFVFVRELDDLGQGNYGFLQVVEYIALLVPGKVVEFMPLAVLLGSIISLGGLAGNSEIIAMQASGISLTRLLAAVLQAAIILALLSFLIADWVVPESATSARNIKNLAQESTTALHSNEGLWIKDESRVLHIEALLPNGFVRNIEIYQLDRQGNLISTTRAASAIPTGSGWELQQVERTIIGDGKSSSQQFPKLSYEGNLPPELLQVFMIEPRQMSSNDLFSYLKFLDDNRLDTKVERLILWQKLFSPLTVVIMCLLAFPFVLGAQRQASTGYRLLIGILLGLSFVVVDRLLTQLGSQFEINAFVIALLPNIIFLGLAIYLLARKLSHGVNPGLLLGTRRQ